MTWLFEGRSQFEWQQTSLLAALLAEPLRDPDVRPEPWSPEDFMPGAASRASQGRPDPTPSEEAMLETIFPGDGG